MKNFISIYHTTNWLDEAIKNLENGKTIYIAPNNLTEIFSSNWIEEVKQTLIKKYSEKLIATKFIDIVGYYYHYSLKN